MYGCIGEGGVGGEGTRIAEMGNGQAIEITDEGGTLTDLSRLLARLDGIVSTRIERQ